MKEAWSAAIERWDTALDLKRDGSARYWTRRILHLARKSDRAKGAKPRPRRKGRVPRGWAKSSRAGER